MDWGTRRKPLGAIVAWSSLALFGVLTILGIAGVVMSLQSQPVATQIETAEVPPEPAPVEERLPEELSFAEVQAADAAIPPEPKIETVATSDAMIASTFEQLVEPVVVPADQIPAGAMAVTPSAQPETAVADAGVQLPLSPERATVATRPRTVGRNAAAWAIESEVPDRDGNITALGYAAQPSDDAVRVGDSSVNVRTGPSVSNRKLFALSAGAEVDVTGKSGEWVAITDAKDRDGWVDASLLQNVDLDAVPVITDAPAAEPEAPAKPANLKKVAGSGVTVRSGPGKSNKALFNLSGGAQVTVLDNSKGWLKIKDGDGRTGWAYQNYIKG